MTAPAFTLADIQKLDPCRIPDGLPVSGKITAAKAVDNGATLSDLIWVASAFGRADKDIERRLRLWMADCGARVLRIYEKQYPADDRVRYAIIMTRQYARGEITEVARATARVAALDAVMDVARAADRVSALEAARAAALVAARVAAMEVASLAALDSARAAARAAAMDADMDAARVAEEQWQLERFIEWMSESEPQDWPLGSDNTGGSQS